jgi:polysaccharide export outer membrane protein
MRFRIHIVHVAARILALGLLSGIFLGCAQNIVERDYEAPGQFLLGPEDVLDITVWKNVDLSKTVVIRPDGLISLPIIGDVQAAGVTANELAERIAQHLRQFSNNPAVSVSVKEINSYSIYVLGEVTKPGKYQAKSFTTILQAISMAGGFTEFAKKNQLQIVRNRLNGDGRLHETRIPIRYKDLLAGQGEPGNVILLSGDTVVVP